MTCWIFQWPCADITAAPAGTAPAARRPVRIRAPGPGVSHPRAPASRTGWRRDAPRAARLCTARLEEHTSVLQSLILSSYAVLYLKKKNTTNTHLTTQDDNPDTST